MKLQYPEKPVLIVDDEEYILRSLSAVLRTNGINNIRTCSDSREVMEIISQTPPSLVLLDLTMPYRSGESLIPDIREVYYDLPILIITGVNELSTAVECMKMGASDYLVKAIENSKLLSAVGNALKMDELKKENQRLKDNMLSTDEIVSDAFSAIITRDTGMISIFRYLTVISKTDQIILIRGETGTGKELVAEAIHLASGKEGTFVSVNVAGLDDNMFSDTLFGHRKGAYSGADNHRPGLIEKASGGTLFLDEIGDMSAASQVKLLRLLEKNEYYTLGSDSLKRASCRIITATNANLEVLMEKGLFRKDLYFRLSSYEVCLPPLRSRSGDFPLLVSHFVEKAALSMGIDTPEVGRAFMESLERSRLNGNVRELISIVNRAVGSCSTILTAEEPVKNGTLVETENTKLKFPDELPDLKSWSNILVDEAMVRSDGNISLAAGLLGISQPGLSKRLAKRK